MHHLPSHSLCYSLWLFGMQSSSLDTFPFTGAPWYIDWYMIIIYGLVVWALLIPLFIAWFYYSKRKESRLLGPADPWIGNWPLTVYRDCSLYEGICVDCVLMVIYLCLSINITDVHTYYGMTLYDYCIHSQVTHVGIAHEMLICSLIAVSVLLAQSPLIGGMSAMLLKLIYHLYCMQY